MNYRESIKQAGSLTNTMNYQVADFIIRIKNACLAGRKKVLFPYSKMAKSIGKLLVEEHFLQDLKEEIKDGKKFLVAEIRYEKRVPVLNDVLIISKPSLRIYKRAKNITRSMGSEVSILSTNKGIMTEEEARKKGVGGEILFKIW